jgi:hypothetical protein
VDEQIGQRAGVSRDTVRKVEALMNNAPEMVKQDLRTGNISINQAFEEYGRGLKSFAEFEYFMYNSIRYDEIPTFAEYFELGRENGKSDKEIEENILKEARQRWDEFLQEIKNESCKPYVEEIVNAWKSITEERSINKAKQLADKIALVNKESEKRKGR